MTLAVTGRVQLLTISVRLLMFERLVLELYWQSVVNVVTARLPQQVGGGVGVAVGGSRRGAAGWAALSAGGGPDRKQAPASSNNASHPNARPAPQRSRPRLFLIPSN